MDWAVFVVQWPHVLGGTASRGLQLAALGELLGFFVVFTAMISMRFL